MRKYQHYDLSLSLSLSLSWLPTEMGDILAPQRFEVHSQTDLTTYILKLGAYILNP